MRRRVFQEVWETRLVPAGHMAPLYRGLKPWKTLEYADSQDRLAIYIVREARPAVVEWPEDLHQAA